MRWSHICLLLPCIAPAVLQSQQATVRDFPDDVIVGAITAGTFDGTMYRVGLNVVRVLSGRLTAGVSLQAQFTPLDRAGRQGTVIQEQGVFFLEEASSKDAPWNIISVGSDGLGLRSAYYPVRGPGPQSPSGSVSERITQELAAAAQLDSNPDYIRRFIAKAPRSSDLAAKLFHRWMSSSEPIVRAYGVGALISTGDTSALGQFADELPTISKLPNAEFVGSSLLAVRNGEPKAVNAIGRIAVSLDARPSTRDAALSALCRVHTKESLPFLYELSRSQDSFVRQQVIAAFSAFVGNMRVAADGLDSSEALDEVLNPGRAQKSRSAYDNAETRKYFHFGPFKDPGEEAVYLQFWRSWFEQNKATLGIAN